MLKHMTSGRFIHSLLIWTSLIVTSYFCVVYFGNYMEGHVDKVFNDKIVNKLEKYYVKSEKPNLETMCIIAECSVMVKETDANTEIYVKDKFSYKVKKTSSDLGRNILENLNDKMYRVYTVSNLKIYSSETIIDGETDRIATQSYLFLSILFLFVFFVWNFYSWVRANYKDREKRELLEDHTQKRITESLHHEIGNPFQGLRDIFTRYAGTIYPCYVYNGFRHVAPEECVVCGGKDHQEPPHEATENMRFMEHNFKRINGVLNLLSRSKSVKNAVEQVNLKELLDLTRCEKMTLNISRVEIQLEEPPFLNNFYLDHNFDNGLFVNIISSLITNSIEAGATIIKISPVLTDNERRCTFFVSDNGHGVLGLNGQLTNGKNIFKYGYSSKDMKWTKKIKAEGWFKRFVRVILKGGDDTSSRGFGLSINRDILKSYNGSITLHENSHRGATFRIDVDVFEKIDK